MTSEFPDELEPPSKSQRKRDAHKLQELGVKLCSCSEAQLRTLKIPEPMIAAIAEYNRLPNSHGARRRQLQFIGKLMRDFDYDELSLALERQEKKETHAPRPTPPSQLWTSRILANGDPVINTLIESHSVLARQKLRQFYRDYQAADDAAGARIRDKLHRYLKPVLDD